jgi:hypothetical protein
MWITFFEAQSGQIWVPNSKRGRSKRGATLPRVATREDISGEVAIFAFFATRPAGDTCGPFPGEEKRLFAGCLAFFNKNNTARVLN